MTTLVLQFSSYFGQLSAEPDESDKAAVPAVSDGQQWSVVLPRS